MNSFGRLFRRGSIDRRGNQSEGHPAPAEPGGPQGSDAGESPWSIESHSGEVVAGSKVLLPFQPSGEMLQFRSELRSALRGQHSARVTRVEAALASTTTTSKLDLENVLTYNVGTSCVMPKSASSIALERQSMELIAEPAKFPHRYRFRFRESDSDDIPLGWSTLGQSWHAACALESATALSVWWALRDCPALAEPDDSPLGIWLSYRGPSSAPVGHLKRSWMESSAPCTGMQVETSASFPLG